jgi:hypothetical protein
MDKSAAEVQKRIKNQNECHLGQKIIKVRKNV